MIAGVRPYPEEVTSGSPWVGNAPRHWSVRRLRATVRSCINGIWGSDPTGGSEDIACVRVADFDRLRLRVRPGPLTMRSIPADARGRRVIDPGDLLVEKSGGGDQQPVGVIVLFDREDPAVSSNFVARMVVAPGYEPRYLVYLHQWLYSIRVNVRAIKQTTGIQNLDLAAYLCEKVPLAPISEQRGIARFLGYADMRILRYVSRKHDLIKLLEEQKRAVIYRAVTRGIDPDVRLKSSGLEWLGDVPGHWRIARVKTELYNLNSRRVPISAANRDRMTNRQYDYYGASGVIDQVEDFLFDDDLLLIAEDGANLVLRNLPLAVVARGQFWVNNHAHILKPRDGCLEFFAALLESVDYTPLITGAAQPKLTQDRLMAMRIPVPPPAEQTAIAEWIKRNTRDLELTIDRARKEVALLREYRTRLIADVVTGKLDVRDAAARLPDQPLETDGPIDAIGLAQIDEGTEGIDLELEEASA